MCFNFNKYLKILITLIFVHLFNLDAVSQVDIRSLSSKTDTVDMGICFVGDSLITSFHIERTGIQDILIKQIGSVITRFSENDPTQIQHEEFVTRQREIVLDEANTSDTIEIIYLATDVLSLYPYGSREARLDLILFDANSDEIIASVTYMLIARKAEYYIDQYDKLLLLDSVYVDGYVRSKSLRIQNVWSEKLELFDAKTEIKSTEIFSDEFTFQDLQLPIKLSSGDSIQWQVNYHPKDLKSDTALMIYSFYPEPILFPDSTVTDTSLAVGFGVENNVRIISSNFIHSNGDKLIIDVGKIPAHNVTEVEFTLDNQGNIPLGIVSEIFEFILNPGNIELSLDNELNLLEFVDLNGHIQPKSVDSTKSYANIKILVKPNDYGEFEFRYRVRTDLAVRQIYGFPDDDQYIDVYIKGTSLLPRLLLESDVIEFGNVVTSSECPNLKTIDFLISNTGNDELYLWSLETKSSKPFSVDPHELRLGVGKDTSIKVSFSPDDLNVFTDTLMLRSVYQLNEVTYKIALTGTGIPRESTVLQISQDLIGKPGSRLSVPIKVQKENISYAKSFTTLLRYDRSILYYSGYDEIGTAVEGLASPDISVTDDGLSIDLEATKQFLSTDVLIYLNFDIYLGSKVVTELIFADSYFSDDICDDVLDIEIQNGIFTIDSVCGLNRKVYQRSNFNVQSVYPNPIKDNLYIKISSKEISDAIITIFNSYGETIIEEKKYTLNKGLTDLILDLSEISSGVYHVCIRSGVGIKYMAVVVD